MRLKVGNQTHEWEGDFDIEEKKIMKAHTALKALLETNYRFSTVPYKLLGWAETIHKSHCCKKRTVQN